MKGARPQWQGNRTQMSTFRTPRPLTSPQKENEEWSAGAEHDALPPPQVFSTYVGWLKHLSDDLDDMHTRERVLLKAIWIPSYWVTTDRLHRSLCCPLGLYIILSAIFVKSVITVLSFILVSLFWKHVMGTFFCAPYIVKEILNKNKYGKSFQYKEFTIWQLRLHNGEPEMQGELQILEVACNTWGACSLG